jgi:hypothetical protein
MASKYPSVDDTLKLLDQLSSAQKILNSLNDDLLRATIHSPEDVPRLRDLVRAQLLRVQDITEQMIAALRAR